METFKMISRPAALRGDNYRKIEDRDMPAFTILVHNGYNFEYRCEIEAKSAIAARKEWYRRNDGQQWRKIKATKVK